LEENTFLRKVAWTINKDFSPWAMQYVIYIKLKYLGN
jgi:hypothetical protein